MKTEGNINSFTDSSSWTILSEIEQRIKNKIEQVGTPLKDWDINIYRGVLTGYNDAFIISTENAPLCPICQKPMIKRVAKKGINADKSFWSCSDYPNCNGTRAV